MSPNPTFSRVADRKRRSAFTLVELLVVIAIIGILIALLLPAVQMAREAARRMQCTNNLKQCSLALHNYHDTYRSFCPGWMININAHSVPNGWGWAVFLLPYVEQKPLQDKLDPGTLQLYDVANDASLRPLLRTVIGEFLCPTCNGEEDSGRTIACAPSGERATAKSNYICCRGFFSRDGVNSGNNMNGAMYGHSKVKFRDIQDGTSNTFAFGERSERRNSANWCGPGGLGNASNVAADVRRKLNHPSNNACFDSLHPGGANFGFCDGSVHFISETIESNPNGVGNTGSIGNFDNNVAGMGVYQHLGVIGDGIPISGWE